MDKIIEGLVGFITYIFCYIMMTIILGIVYIKGFSKYNKNYVEISKVLYNNLNKEIKKSI